MPSSSSVSTDSTPRQRGLDRQQDQQPAQPRESSLTTSLAANIDSNQRPGSRSTDAATAALSSAFRDVETPVLDLASTLTMTPQQWARNRRSTRDEQRESTAGRESTPSSTTQRPSRSEEPYWPSRQPRQATPLTQTGTPRPDPRQLMSHIEEQISALQERLATAEAERRDNGEPPLQTAQLLTRQLAGLSDAVAAHARHLDSMAPPSESDQERTLPLDLTDDARLDVMMDRIRADLASSSRTENPPLSQSTRPFSAAEARSTLRAAAADDPPFRDVIDTSLLVPPREPTETEEQDPSQQEDEPAHFAAVRNALNEALRTFPGPDLRLTRTSNNESGGSRSGNTADRIERRMNRLLADRGESSSSSSSLQQPAQQQSRPSNERLIDHLNRVRQSQGLPPRTNLRSTPGTGGQSNWARNVSLNDLDRRLRMRRMRENNTTTTAGDTHPSGSAYGDRVPAQQSLYDWAPAHDEDEEDINESDDNDRWDSRRRDIAEIMQTLRRQDPNMHPEMLRVVARAQLDAEREIAREGGTTNPTSNTTANSNNDNVASLYSPSEASTDPLAEMTSTTDAARGLEQAREQWSRWGNFSGRTRDTSAEMPRPRRTNGPYTPMRLPGPSEGRSGWTNHNSPLPPPHTIGSSRYYYPSNSPPTGTTMPSNALPFGLSARRDYRRDFLENPPWDPAMEAHYRNLSRPLHHHHHPHHVSSLLNENGGRSSRIQIENAMRYLAQLRESTCYADSIRLAIQFDFATSEFLHVDDDVEGGRDERVDLVKNPASIPALQPTSWLEPGVTFEGSQHASTPASRHTRATSRRGSRAESATTVIYHLPNNQSISSTTIGGTSSGAGGAGDDSDDSTADHPSSSIERPREAAFDPARPLLSHGFTHPNPQHSSNLPPAGSSSAAAAGQDHWPVRVTIQSVDYDTMTLTGTMEAYNVPSGPSSSATRNAVANGSSSTTTTTASSSRNPPPRTGPTATGSTSTTTEPTSTSTSTSADTKNRTSNTFTTYLEGQILDFREHYSLLTETFPTTAATDANYWRQLPPLSALSDHRVARQLLSLKGLSQLQEEYVLMRWKEKCFLSPRTDSTSCASHHKPATSSTSTGTAGASGSTGAGAVGGGGGLTISGFYYVSLHRASGQVEGLYFDPQSSPYQHLRLRPAMGVERVAWSFR